MGINFWDNQSTDNSRKIIESFKDKRIRYFYSDNFTDLGGARAKRHLIKGDYLAILDTDDIWYPKKLEKQLGYFMILMLGFVLVILYFLL